MDYAKDEIITNAVKLIENLQEKHSIKAAYLFGSYSKGFAGKNSDIDIAVVLDKIRDGSPFNETFEIFHEAQKYNSLYEVICFSEQEFINEDESLIKHIKREGIKIV